MHGSMYALSVVSNSTSRSLGLASDFGVGARIGSGSTGDWTASFLSLYYVASICFFSRNCSCSFRSCRGRDYTNIGTLKKREQHPPQRRGLTVSRSHQPCSPNPPHSPLSFTVPPLYRYHVPVSTSTPASSGSTPAACSAMCCAQLGAWTPGRGFSVARGKLQITPQVKNPGVGAENGHGLSVLPFLASSIPVSPCWRYPES
ncbi:hypothetical protein B0H11DRAFT_1961562 [Mycena galericulata]|nr:hypothetical protein B0H11DRAFT_1961562 [Mycena galericulata]